MAGRTVRVLMVCMGNICRSVAAEMVLRHLAAERGLTVAVDSAGFSDEEHGNDIYPPMKEALRRHGIPFTRHAARQMTAADAERFDLLIGMDRVNLWGIRQTCGEAGDNGLGLPKYSLLLDWAGRTDAVIEDPWYTRNFDLALGEIIEGCEGLLDTLEDRGLAGRD